MQRIAWCAVSLPQVAKILSLDQLIYDKSRIKFYSIAGTETTFFNYQPKGFRDTTYDSVLNVQLFSKADIVYMQLSDPDIDTLAISYNTSNTKCCETITEIKNLRLNNSIDIPGDEGTQEIRK